ncbi:hypothetical protein EUTSA_v10029146mg [Eutrema salsugineum]|uniref:Protein kinase domain-containing protein n=1 Tax=Eutrema salsugineum TaxID=72664 RepID=V4KJX0_EUTSA|nr:hypothetical protein EUTSA_v10029146mg [Eutrema salsugineum]
MSNEMRSLYRVFKEGELYVKHCMDSTDWWGKVINLHQNKDSVEFHIHNLFCYFPAVVEAIEAAGEISGLDPSEMERKRVVFSRKYDREWNNSKLFQWRFGKQYLVPRDICSRFEHSWRKDRWNLVEALQEKRKSDSDGVGKTENRLADLLLKKLTGLEQFNGKLFSSSILLGSKDYQVRKWLVADGQYKDIQCDLEPLSSEISSLLALFHSNILQYLCGLYDEEMKECFLVMELMHKYLQSYMKENCGPRRRYLFSVSVLRRSHTDGYFHAKISGFGLSSVKSCSSSSRPNTPDPVIWYAPEVLAEMEQQGKTDPKSKLTHKADVYSFAMVCFELITGKVPFEDSHLQGEKMAINIRMGERPLFSFPSPKYLVSLIKRCWHTEPSQRPNFSSICRILRYIKKFLVVNQDHGHPQMQTLLVDCWDLEARFLRKFPGDHSSGCHAASVTQIPFQLYSYRVFEREKMNPKKLQRNRVSVVEDPPIAMMIRDTRSLCLDTISEYSNTRSVYSEAPHKKVSALKKTPSLGSGKLRSTGNSPVKARSSPKASPLSPFGRSIKARKDNRLPLSPMSPLSPGRHRQHTGHASYSELT